MTWVENQIQCFYFTLPKLRKKYIFCTDKHAIELNNIRRYRILQEDSHSHTWSLTLMLTEV